MRKMDKERKGEIAYILLKRQVAQEGIRFASIAREIGNIAKRTGVPQNELKKFGRTLIEEILEETFGE